MRGLAWSTEVTEWPGLRFPAKRIRAAQARLLLPWAVPHYPRDIRLAPVPRTDRNGFEVDPNAGAVGAITVTVHHFRALVAVVRDFTIDDRHGRRKDFSPAFFAFVERGSLVVADLAHARLWAFGSRARCGPSLALAVGATH